MPRDDATILDILKAANLALAFKGTMDKAAFFADLKTQSAILHQLLVLGEAVKRLSDAFRTQHLGVGWIQIAGMRNILIHEYDHVDLDEVWQTVTVDVPHLIALLEPLAPREGGE